MGIKKDSPIDKKIILVKKYSSRSIGRKIETFCWSLDKNNTGSQDFGHSKKDTKSHFIQNLFSKKSLPNNSESGRRGIGGTGSKRNVEEEIHQKSSTIIRRVCKQLIPCKKEGCGPKTSDKFEATQCIYPILSL